MLQHYVHSTRLYFLISNMLGLLLNYSHCFFAGASVHAENIWRKSRSFLLLRGSSKRTLRRQNWYAPSLLASRAGQGRACFATSRKSGHRNSFHNEGQAREAIPTPSKKCLEYKREIHRWMMQEYFFPATFLSSVSCYFGQGEDFLSPNTNTMDLYRHLFISTSLIDDFTSRVVIWHTIL